MCRILKGHHPNSVFVDAVFKRIGVDRDRYFVGVPRKRGYVSKHKLRDSTSAIILLQRTMLDPQKTLEREALLKRNREIRDELAQIDCNIREIKAQLPLEEQLCLKLRRFMTPMFLNWRARFE
jgi:hypothetical protein